MTAAQEVTRDDRRQVLPCPRRRSRGRWINSNRKDLTSIIDHHAGRHPPRIGRCIRRSVFQCHNRLAPAPPPRRSAVPGDPRPRASRRDATRRHGHRDRRRRRDAPPGSRAAGAAHYQDSLPRLSHPVAALPRPRSVIPRRHEVPPDPSPRPPRAAGARPNLVPTGQSAVPPTRRPAPRRPAPARLRRPARPPAFSTSDDGVRANSSDSLSVLVSGQATWTRSARR